MFIVVGSHGVGCQRPGMSLNSPCRGFVTRWNGGACPPAWNGPWLPIGVLGLPNWVFGSTHGLRASVWALGAGIKVLPFCTSVREIGRRAKCSPSPLGDTQWALRWCGRASARPPVAVRAVRCLPLGLCTCIGLELLANCAYMVGEWLTIGTTLLCSA